MHEKPNLIMPGQTAVLASMHGKEAVIAPLLHKALGLHVEVCTGLDTDQFGTFSGDIPRQGTAYESAQAKIAAAFKLHPSAHIAIASEGSFAPLPAMPYLTRAQELVLLQDQRTGLEVTGLDVRLDAHFGSLISDDMESLMTFATTKLFPSHGMIVIAAQNGRCAPELWLDKTIATQEDLVRSLHTALKLSGQAMIQTDQRAHRNPTRMKAIESATQKLIDTYFTPCPQCQSPGYESVQALLGLPCEICHSPTSLIASHIWHCKACGYESITPNSKNGPYANALYCLQCNP